MLRSRCSGCGKDMTVYAAMSGLLYAVCPHCDRDCRRGGTAFCSHCGVREALK